MKKSNVLVAALIAAMGFSGGTGAFTPAHAFRGATPARRRSKKTSYGQGLRNQFTRQQRDKLPKTGALRDEHGAYTFVGRSSAIRHGQQLVGWYEGERRVWLAGVSAQRGF